MWYLLYPLTFAVLLKKIKDKKNSLTYLAVIIYYLLASCTAAYLMTTYDYKILPDMPFAIVFLVMSLLLLIYPLSSIDKFSKETIHWASPAILNVLTYIVIITCFTTIFYNLVDYSFQFSFDQILENRAALADFTVDLGLLNYPYCMGNSYWYSAIALAFYYIICEPQKKATIFLLLISSLSNVSWGLVHSGRDSVLCYCFVFGLMTCLFYRKATEEWKSKLKYIVMLFCVLAVGFVCFVTYARFVGVYNETSLGTIDYFGQGIAHFEAAYYGSYNKKDLGDLTFPFLSGIEGSRYNRDAVAASGLAGNVFATVIGSWITDNGWFWTIVAVIVYSLFFRYVMRRRLDVFTMIYISWIIHFVFYLNFYFVDCINPFRLATILLIFALDVVSRHQISTR